MAGPEVICTLIPSNHATLQAFKQLHNRKYCITVKTNQEFQPFDSRETKSSSSKATIKHERNVWTSGLRLTTDQKLKSPGNGYSFGANPACCDIVLGSQCDGISDTHFYITFTRFEEEVDLRLALIDASIKGTAVSYSGQAKDEIRSNFGWVLEPDKGATEWELQVCVCQFRFKVVLERHDSCKEEYEHKVQAFNKQNKIDLEILQYAKYQHGRAIYIKAKERALGRSLKAEVNKVINVSTGDILVRKSFFRLRREVMKDPQKHKEWLATVSQEIDILKRCFNRHVVKIKGQSETDPCFFFMPYYSLGSLKQQYTIEPFSKREIVRLFYQASRALQRLHDVPVMHRNLKPSKILIKTRKPLEIKLAGFGSASYKDSESGDCGTPYYAAPEIGSNTSHSNKVDIWALGVIILDCIRGPPKVSQQRERAGGWASYHVSRIEGHGSDPLLKIVAGTLRVDARQRYDVYDCLRGLSELFDDEPEDRIRANKLCPGFDQMLQEIMGEGNEVAGQDLRNTSTLDAQKIMMKDEKGHRNPSPDHDVQPRDQKRPTEGGHRANTHRASVAGSKRHGSAARSSGDDSNGEHQTKRRL